MAYQTRSKEEQREYDKLRNERVKEKALAKLGGKCCRCGFSDWRALEISHVNNDGLVDRAKGLIGRRLHEAVILDLDGRYELLCANCHTIKHFEERGYLDSSKVCRKDAKPLSPAYSMKNGNPTLRSVTLKHDAFAELGVSKEELIKFIKKI
jgi:hypothetical protein